MSSFISPRNGCTIKYCVSYSHVERKLEDVEEQIGDLLGVFLFWLKNEKLSFCHVYNDYANKN